MGETLGLGVMCGGFVVVFLILFLAMVLWRWFKHRETMAMIQQGLAPSTATRQRNGNGNGASKALLAWGVGIVFFGFAILAAMGLAAAFLFSDPYLPAGPPMAIFLIPGLFVVLMGFALVTIYLVTRPARDEHHNGTNPPDNPADADQPPYPDR